MIVFFRVLLLAVAAAAVAAGVAIGLGGHRSNVAAAARYACPMHPEVRAGRPGECPICRMALEPVGRPAAGTKLSGAQMATAGDLAAVENVRKHNIVDFVRHHSLLVPMQELRGPARIDPDGSVVALFYDDQVEALTADEVGTFSSARAPGSPVTVRRTGEAAVPWDRSTSWIRFRPVVGRGGKAAPEPAPSWLRSPQGGEPGWVELAPRPRQVLTVPASAVLQSPEGPYVLAWAGSGFRFEKRPIEIGETFDKPGFAVVLSGLRVNERVISRATFFLDSDRRSGERSDEVSWVAP